MHPDPIIVHQMGKVGSKTVELSLRNAYEELGILALIYHTHILNDFERIEGYVLREKHQQDLAGPLAAVAHGESVRKLIDENPAQHWNIISLVRDPIARNISAFFESLPSYIPDWPERYTQGTLTSYEIQALFLESTTAYERPDFWFDSQVKSVPAFGIDVYATAFPHHSGYKIYSGAAQANLLLLRLENLKECAERAMHEFLGLEHFSLHNTNTTSEKDFATLYREFIALPLPMEYVTEQYKSRFAQHFYSAEELGAFIEHWTKGTELANNPTFRSNHFAQMDQSVRTLATQVVKKTHTIQVLTAQITTLEKQSAELFEIKASRAWKLVTFLRGIQRRFFPPSNPVTTMLQRFTHVILPILKIFKKPKLESDLELLRSSELFDPAWYLANNLDVSQKHMDPAYHYLTYGGFQGYDPSPNFSSSWYIENYEDVKKAKANPLVHYLIHGKKEGRSRGPQKMNVKGLE